MSAKINPWRLFYGAYVPEWLMRSKIVSPGAKLCYARLCRFAGQEGIADPEQAVLAEELAVDLRTVQRYVRELSEANLVEVTQHGMGRPNTYEFLNHPAMWGDETDPTDLSGVDPTDVSHPSSSRESATRVNPRSLRSRAKRGRTQPLDNDSDLASVGSLASDEPPPPTNLRDFKPKTKLSATYLGMVFDHKSRDAGIPPAEIGGTGGLVTNIKKWVADGATLEQVLRAMDLFFLSISSHHQGGKRVWLSFVNHWPALHKQVTRRDITDPDYYSDKKEQTMDSTDKWLQQHGIVQ